MPTTMNPAERIRHNFDESLSTISACAGTLAEPLAAAAQCIIDALLAGNKVLACGNGGSAADAQHFTSELLNRFVAERPPLPAVALTADNATLTAIANDYHYDQVFAKQVTALGQPGDVLLVLTTSGNSKNVLRAIEAAHEREMHCIALSGRDGGKLSQMLYEGDIDVCVPASSTARIQEVHKIAIHCLCDVIDSHLLGQP